MDPQSSRSPELFQSDVLALRVSHLRRPREPDDGGVSKVGLDIELHPRLDTHGHVIVERYFARALQPAVLCENDLGQLGAALKLLVSDATDARGYRQLFDGGAFETVTPDIFQAFVQFYAS